MGRGRDHGRDSQRGNRDRSGAGRGTAARSVVAEVGGGHQARLPNGGPEDNGRAARVCGLKEGRTMYGNNNCDYDPAECREFDEDAVIKCRRCGELKPDCHFGGIAYDDDVVVCFDCEGEAVRARWVAAKTTVEMPVFTMAALLV